MSFFSRPPPATEVRTEEEVVQAVRLAREEDGWVRVRGSGGSKSEVTSAPGTLLELDQADRLLEVDGSVVTVPAGMTSGRLQELLQPEGLTLPTVGEWKNATVAGALATGTHGGSLHHGIMPTSVRRVRMVTGTGDVTEIARGEPDFDEVAVSLGALGIVTEVTLECVPRFALEMASDVIPFDDYLRDPVAQEGRTEFHASVWLPDARRVIRFGADRVSAPSPTARRRERFGKWTALASFLARRLGFHRAVSSRFFRWKAVGDGADILSPLDVPPRVARFRNVANGIRGRKAAELAVPAARAGEVLSRLEAFFRQRSAPLNNPIGLRMSAADDLTLSPCQGRDTLWLDIFFDEDEAFEAGLASIGGEVEARCHWGKTLLLSPEALRARYPGWETFRETRDRLDPDEVFANALTDALGLTASGVGVDGT